jgi:hypothetical protein
MRGRCGLERSDPPTHPTTIARRLLMALCAAIPLTPGEERLFLGL